MNDTFCWGLGRTWFSLFVVMALATVGLVIGKLTADLWWSIIQFCLGAGTVKSTVVGAAGAIKKEKP